ncbi:MAG TPA: hypothetical protein VK541_07905 [Pedobacter sp.]|uniref:hypothetical protein n=1 Tax=Pedobacter sp. TaxID=1411316 RepID=UPI002C6DF7E5|nr:hypothetical protein [Pedobacter sp.]HMI02388.1 hypothetical protein [Pedobacter sp.]
MEEHLDDNDLQQYALDQSALGQQPLQHIRHCKHCQIRAGQYAQILRGLQHAPKMTVEIDLAALVLPAEKKKFPWGIISITALIFTGLLVIGSGVVLLGQDIRAIILTEQGRHFYLLPGLAIVLLVAGCGFYYREYKHRLRMIGLSN